MHFGGPFEAPDVTRNRRGLLKGTPGRLACSYDWRPFSRDSSSSRLRMRRDMP